MAGLNFKRAKALFLVALLPLSWAAKAERKKRSLDDGCGLLDSELTKRGLGQEALSEMKAHGIRSFARLFRLWSSVGGKLPRVVLAGDSLMSTLQDLVVGCAAQALGCRIEIKGRTTFYPDGTRVGPKRRRRRGKGTKPVRNAIPEGFGFIQDMYCPKIKSAFQLYHLKYYNIGDVGAGEPRPMLLLRPKRLLQEIQGADWLYINTGHGMFPETAWGAIRKAAEQLHLSISRRPTRNQTRSAYVRTFVVARTPQHFVGAGDGTGNPNVMESGRTCTCDLPNWRDSVHNADRVLLSELIKEANDELRSRYGVPVMRFVDQFYQSFIQEPRCAMVFGSGDCTHYIPHPAIYAGQIDEMISAALATQGVRKDPSHVEM